MESTDPDQPSRPAAQDWAAEPAPDDEDHRATLGRLIAFSDGVFAIAITLLALDLSVGDLPDNLTSAQLTRQLHDMVPQLMVFALSFVIIAIYWINHHRTFRYIRRYDRRLVQFNFLLLFFIVLLPIPTSLLGRYGDLRIAVIVYAAAIAAAAFSTWLLWWHATHGKRLVDPDMDELYITRVSLRMLVPVVVFLLSIGISFISVTLAEMSWLLNAFGGRVVHGLLPFMTPKIEE